MRPENILYFYTCIVIYILSANIYCYHVIDLTKGRTEYVHAHKYEDEDNMGVHFIKREVKNIENETVANEPKLLPPSVTSTTQTTNSLYDSTNSSMEENLNLEGLNTSIVKFDNHKYYRSYSIQGMAEVHNYWVDLDRLPPDKVVSHDTLSSAYRRALTVSLSFDFPFYGHILRNVTIATGGFLFTGSFLHKWLAATQYIAPLMANFDTSIATDSSVKYADNGTSFTVQWDKVVLQDNKQAGSFTFQATISQTGEIVFAYKDVPLIVNLIGDVEHPVKVGLSDAYIEEKTIFYVRKKTIYEYHKIDLKSDMKINNWTAVIFEPLPNCIFFKNCHDCLVLVSDFKCEWCQEVNRCSDGLDRLRQDWMQKGCDKRAVSNESFCAALPPPTVEPSVSPLSPSHKEQSVPSGGSHSAMVGFIIVILVIASIGAWVAYAYFYPHSTSGQLLIKYRPSAWSWRRGEARYTAATIHSIHM